MGLADPEADLILAAAFVLDVLALELVPGISLYVRSIFSISPHAFSLWMDLRGGSPVWRIEGRRASMAPTACSADILSGVYLDPPSASSIEARIRSEMI